MENKYLLTFVYVVGFPCCRKWPDSIPAAHNAAAAPVRLWDPAGAEHIQKVCIIALFLIPWMEN